jgi:predicted kinase
MTGVRYFCQRQRNENSGALPWVEGPAHIAQRPITGPAAWSLTQISARREQVEQRAIRHEGQFAVSLQPSSGSHRALPTLEDGRHEISRRRSRMMDCKPVPSEPRLLMGVQMDQPTLFLTVGLPGTGKTTAARRIEAEHGALRLTKDEWMKALYGRDNPASASDVIEGRLIQIGMRALELGISVVIDYGLWSRDERSALRQAAADIGAAVVIYYFELTPAEQRKHLDQRLAEAPHETWPISKHELAEWASKIDIPTSAELDGSEPIGDPPDGFATWHEWTAHRWPPSVT